MKKYLDILKSTYLKYWNHRQQYKNKVKSYLLGKKRTIIDVSLFDTEKRLISLFVIGAFAFLLLFEAFFIGTRLILEERFQKEEFASQIQGIIEGRGAFERNKRLGPARIGISSIILDSQSRILEIRGNLTQDELLSFISKEFILGLPIDRIIKHDDTLLFKKKQIIQNTELTILFFKRSGYPIDGILRDILRFLAIDIVLIIPFYFIAIYYVRRTLLPVSENIETMSHFIHDAGHELKTPLAIVSGNLQILRDSKKIDDIKLIEESITTIHSMAESLDGLVELANLRAPANTSRLNLKKSIEETLGLQSEDIEKKKITTTLNIPESLDITIEKKHFQILLSNLVSNAIRYNKDSGNITITAEGKKLIISDTGIGMTKDESKKIFERFYRVDRTGKIPGTGIGLTIVDRILRLYGWTIDVKSEKGVGTNFIIYIR